MFNMYFIMTVVVFLCVLVIGALLAFYDYNSSRKNKFFNNKLKINMEKSKFPKVRKFFNNALSVVAFFLNWIAYAIGLIATIILFYFDYYIASLGCLLMVLIGVIIHRVTEKHQDSPKYPKIFVSRFFQISGILAIIFSLGILIKTQQYYGNKELVNRVKQETNGYEVCKTEEFKKYYVISNPYRKLDNCNSIIQTEKANKELLIQLHNCAKPYLSYKNVGSQDWAFQVLGNSWRKIHFHNLKKQHKCE